MKHGIKKQIAQSAGISGAMISMILHSGKRPSWKVAKKLASVTNSKPEQWLESPPEIIAQIIAEYGQSQNQVGV